MIFFIHEKDIYFAFRKLREAKAECKNFKKNHKQKRISGNPSFSLCRQEMDPRQICSKQKLID